MFHIDTMPNLRPDIQMQRSHTIALPQMCPVSHNPQPGSTITITYTPDAWFLENYALAGYINHYVGGWARDGMHIRDMEQTIQTIAADCRNALQVDVSVSAHLVLDTEVANVSIVALRVS